MENANKTLETMSLNELGELFPIVLKEYDPKWRDCYEKEKEVLIQAFPLEIIRIHHIGSTSVPNLLSKPTIDILIEITDETDVTSMIETMKQLGYYSSYLPQNPPPFRMFMKGYTPHGFEGQAFHVHLRYLGDWDQLYFRDYLKLHPEVSKEYAKIKLSLWQQYEKDREAYTSGKTAFIKHVTILAREEFGNRYRTSKGK